MSADTTEERIGSELRGEAVFEVRLSWRAIIRAAFGAKVKVRVAYQVPLALTIAALPGARQEIEEIVV